LNHYILGVDPDLDTCGVAMLKNGALFRVALLERDAQNTGARGSEAALEMIEALRDQLQDYLYDPEDCNTTLVVEGQEIYRPGVGAPPRSILPLTLISGAVIGLVGAATSFCPAPKTWKGQVPKEVHHKRVLKKLGLASAQDLAPYFMRRTPLASEWQHVLDACGLALWGKEQLEK